MTTLEEISRALAGTLEAIPDLAVLYGPGGAHPPFAFVMPPQTIDYQETFARELRRATLDVYVLVAPADVDTEVAVGQAWPYLEAVGPLSVRAAILADPTLGGLVEALTVPQAHAMTSEEVAGIRHLGYRWPVEIRWRDQ